MILTKGTKNTSYKSYFNSEVFRWKRDSVWYVTEEKTPNAHTSPVLWPALNLVKWKRPSDSVKRLRKGCTIKCQVPPTNTSKREKNVTCKIKENLGLSN